MDLNAKEKVEEVSKLEGAGTLSDKNMESRSLRSISSKDMIFRADKIDLKSLDVQLEKHLSRVWSNNLEKQNQQRPKEVWEIDPSKLEIKYLVAKGTYGTVYRGAYDNQDVAGNICFYVCLMILFATCYIWNLGLLLSTGEYRISRTRIKRTKRCL